MENMTKKAQFRLWDSKIHVDGCRIFTSYEDVVDFIKENLVKEGTKSYVMVDKDGNEAIAFTITSDGNEIYPAPNNLIRKNSEEDKQQLLLPSGMA